MLLRAVDRAVLRINDEIVLQQEATGSSYQLYFIAYGDDRYEVRILGTPIWDSEESEVRDDGMIEEEIREALRELIATVSKIEV